MTAAGAAGARPAVRLRVVLGLAAAEASLLVRNVLALAGLLAGGALIWTFIHSLQPLWWNVGWEVGEGQLILAMAVLAAAQLAAGRASRDGMAALYASFPASKGTRTLGHLIALAGALPASLVLTGVAAATVELIGAIGTPNITVLAGGVLLVIASGAVGVAIGVRFPHPLAGVLGALALFAISSQSARFSGAVIWLLPWEFHQDDLTALNRLVAESASPAAAQHCTTASRVRYCLYPGFGSLLPTLAAPVNDVLARVPVRPGGPLTVSQIGMKSLDSTLTHGHQASQLTRWTAQLRRSAAAADPASAIYLPLWAWPAFGGQVEDARFNIALATADWAVGLPLAENVGPPCVPFDQAREAIAIWLAIVATQPPAGELQAGLPAHGLAGGPVVDNTIVPIWNFPGQGAGQVDQFGSGPPQTTEAGYLLARAMTRLPAGKVEDVLKSGWSRWISVPATDSQLAGALGLPMPAVPHLPASSAAGLKLAGPSVRQPACRT